MLTYVADVFGHALVVPLFYLVDKLRYNEGSFFVKQDSGLNGFWVQDILKRVSQFS